MKWGAAIASFSNEGNQVLLSENSHTSSHQVNITACYLVRVRHGFNKLHVLHLTDSWAGATSTRLSLMEREALHICQAILWGMLSFFFRTPIFFWVWGGGVLFSLCLFLAHFRLSHLLITYSLERPNAELVAPQNAENSFGSPQWNYLILMPGNAGQGPVLICWIKPRRSSASELTDNYSKPLNLRGEGCQGCPWSPFSLCFVWKDFHFMWQRKKITQWAKPGIETCPSGWIEK